MLLEPLEKEFAGHLDGENITCQLHRFNGFKPGLVGLRFDVILNKKQTIIPYR
jgi:hypothetical protein